MGKTEGRMDESRFLQISLFCRLHTQARNFFCSTNDNSQTTNKRKRERKRSTGGEAKRRRQQAHGEEGVPRDVTGQTSGETHLPKYEIVHFVARNTHLRSSSCVGIYRIIVGGTFAYCTSTFHGGVSRHGLVCM